MAKEGQIGGGALDSITGAAQSFASKGPAPVHLWTPPYCGEIDMRIAADGTWFYQKTPIGRPALVKLFASVLKREGDRYFLVTPVEKCGIVVEDAPFLAVEMRKEPVSTDQPESGPTLHFRTNVDDWSPAAGTTRCVSIPSLEPAGLSPICMCDGACGPK